MRKKQREKARKVFTNDIYFLRDSFFSVSYYISSQNDEHEEATNAIIRLLMLIILPSRVYAWKLASVHYMKEIPSENPLGACNED